MYLRLIPTVGAHRIREKGKRLKEYPSAPDCQKKGFLKRSRPVKKTLGQEKERATEKGRVLEGKIQGMLEGWRAKHLF